VLSIKNKKTIAESFEPSQYNAIVFYEIFIKWQFAIFKPGRSEKEQVCCQRRRSLSQSLLDQDPQEQNRNRYRIKTLE
jgi:hypothetical protein